MPRLAPRKKKVSAAAAAAAAAPSDDEESISGPGTDNDEEESISGPDDDEEESEDEILAAALTAKMAAPSPSSPPPSSSSSSRKKTPTSKVKGKFKALSKTVASPKNSSPSPTKRGGIGAKRTKPKGESQKEAQARCLEARTTGLAMLAPLDLDGREEALHAQGRRTLRDPQDDEYISPLNCLVRSQIEIFRASEDHPKSAFVDQIGLRCVNCATACEADPNARAAAGAEKFPQCKDNIGAAIRNWHVSRYYICVYVRFAAMSWRYGFWIY
jgi:hypothetical protein